MGHYYADLMCETCGKVRCICPPTPQKPQTGWLVKGDFTVCTVQEFDAEHCFFKTKWGDVPMSPLVYRMGATIYKTRRAAERAALQACEKAVEEARSELLRLKKVLKVERPWEKK